VALPLEPQANVEPAAHAMAALNSAAHCGDADAVGHWPAQAPGVSLGQCRASAFMQAVMQFWSGVLLSVPLSPELSEPSSDELSASVELELPSER